MMSRSLSCSTPSILVRPFSSERTHSPAILSTLIETFRPESLKAIVHSSFTCETLAVATDVFFFETSVTFGDDRAK